MRKIIGNKNRFAAEYALEKENDSESALYGQAFFWIDNKRIGNYGLVTRLDDMAHSTIWIIHDSGNREDQSLCALSPSEFYRLIYHALYSSEQPFDNSLVPEIPARFDVTIRNPAFDGWLFFLLDCDLESRLTYSNLNNPENIFSITLNYGEFDSVIKQFHDEIEELYNKRLKCNNSI